MKTQVYITMNDLVFENRNQSYGAYYLRTHYNRIAAKAMSVAFLLLLLAWATPVIMNRLTDKNEMGQTEIKTSGIIELMNVNPDPDFIEPPKMPDLLEKQIAFFTPVVARNVTTDVPTRGDFDSLQAGHFTVRVGLDPGSIIDSTTSNTVGIDIDEPIIIVQKMAEYPGGVIQLYKDISNNLTYPESSKDLQVEGKVTIKFVVGKNGKIREIEIARSNVDDACNQAAIKAISKLSDWEPAEHSGYKCATYFYLPIEFKLQR